MDQALRVLTVIDRADAGDQAEDKRQPGGHTGIRSIRGRRHGSGGSRVRRIRPGAGSGVNGLVYRRGLKYWHMFLAKNGPLSGPLTDRTQGFPTRAAISYRRYVRMVG